MKLRPSLDRRILRPLVFQPTVRWRLTLLYSLMFLICGAVLLAISYEFFIKFAFSYPPKAGGPDGKPATSSLAALDAALGQVRDADLHRLLVGSGIALGVMALVSGVLGWVMAGRVLAPMEAAFDAQRRFVANASHELRTPLAMMRTTLDVAVAKPGGVPAETRELDAELRVDLDHAEQLLESFLTLARAEDGQLGDDDRVALEPLITSALSDRANEIGARQLTVTTHLGAGEVAGSATLLRRMIENVLENAVRHNQPGGSIEVALTPVNGRQTRVVVDSSGPVLDRDAVAQLAQPFKRLRQDRTGSEHGHGLGLSIVAAVAAAHDGRLELRARAEGGLRVQITLPASAGAQPAHAR